MHEQLIESLVRKVKFTNQEIEQLKPYFIPKKIRKRQYILNAGDVCQHITFVEKVVLRYPVIYKTDWVNEIAD